MPREDELVGRYRVVREIGRGGMAAVYLARQTDLDRDVALKQLGAFHATDPAAAARFLQESRITGSLGHPNIVTVHEYLQHEGVPYIAMEYLERGSLRPHVRSLSLAQIAGVLEAVLAALAHAAEQGIVHRDLKPENLMITRNGTVKVADFGIAKAVNEVQTSFATATGTTVGTPAYMSPEQAMAKGVGPPTDLYALGVMAYEMLVGRVPYSADTPIAVLLQHVNEPLPRPLDVKPDLDPDLAAWLETMLAKDPADRPPDAAAAWDAFEGIVIGILGPRWRRDARLLDDGSAAAALPLTPAPFESVRSPATPPPESRPADPAPAATAPPRPVAGPPLAPAPTGFETFGRPGDPARAPVAAPAPAPPPPVAPAPTGFETFARPGAAPEAEAAAPADAPASDAPPPSVDGFRTFDPQPRSAPPPPPPAPPSPPAPAPPPAPEPAPPPEPPAPVAGPAEEPADQTIPPRSREPRPADAPPAEPGPRLPGGRRRGLILGGGAVVVAAVVGVVALTAGGGGGDGGQAAPPPTTAPTGPLAPDLVLEERPDLVASGGALLVSDPAGRVVRMEDGRAAATLTDPAAPAAVAVAGDRAVVADGEGVTTATADGLRALSTTGFPGAAALAALGEDVAVAGAQGAGGRVCVAGAERLGPCAALDFAPTGLGAAAERFFAADGAGGRLVPLQLSGGALSPGTPIPVGARPHGRMVEDRGRLYVPVERGIAALDLGTGQVVGTFATPTTPADLAVAGDTGLLVAALPAGEQVAIFDTTQPAEAPRLVPVGGPPSALAETDGGIQVLTTGGSLVSLDPAAGTAAPGTPVAGFGAPAAAARLQRVTSSRSGRRVTLTLALGSGRLADGDLRPADRSIGDGRAALELWQGGITSNVRNVTRAGVTVNVARRPGRLVVALAAADGAFQSLSSRVVRGGRAVSVVLTAPAPEPATPTPGPSPGPSPSPSPTPSPTPTPTPSPDPGFETG